MRDANKLLHDTLATEDYRLSLRDFAICMFNEFNGPEGLAREFKLCFDRTVVGSTPRVQMLNNAMRLLERVDGEEGEDGDAEQIEAQLRELLNEEDGGK